MLAHEWRGSALTMSDDPVTSSIGALPGTILVQVDVGEFPEGCAPVRFCAVLMREDESRCAHRHLSRRARHREKRGMTSYCMGLRSTFQQFELLLGATVAACSSGRIDLEQRPTLCTSCRGCWDSALKAVSPTKLPVAEVLTEELKRLRGPDHAADERPERRLARGLPR
jgi:hypothetical protein